jgi:hypothetical protein
MARAHPPRPCENCPYRKDAPTRLWHRSEFEGVLDADADTFGGKVFNCHKHAALTPDQRGFCAGWLLDQKRRGLPSIQLRLILIQEPEAVAALDAVNADGLEMYSTVKGMCRANGVRPRRTRNAGER